MGFAAVLSTFILVAMEGRLVGGAQRGSCCWPSFSSFRSAFGRLVRARLGRRARERPPDYPPDASDPGEARARRLEAVLGPRGFCEPCGRLKPFRTHHCKVCGRCVLRYDHHCPWINGCVGANNLGPFLHFVAGTTALAAFASALGAGLFAYDLLGSPDPLEAARAPPASLLAVGAATAFPVLLCLSLPCFLGLHAAQLARNETTVEGLGSSTLYVGGASVGTLWTPSGARRLLPRFWPRRTSAAASARPTGRTCWRRRGCRPRARCARRPQGIV